MNPEDIKIGETYNVRVKVVKKTDLFIHTRTGVDTALNGCYLFEYAESEVFSPINSANGIKSAETDPKYDQNRKFREGDIVEPCSVKGRWLSEAWKNRAGIHFIVTMSEDADGRMLVKDPDSVIDGYVDAVYFQLVTPVKERERYYIEHDSMGYAIIDRQNVGYVAHFKAVQHPNAKEAAEAERDRLNAEYRKEQSNG